MLIDKHTWCFSCDYGELVRKPVEGGDVFFVDSCFACGAMKHTIIRGEAAGTVFYKKGK